MAGELFVSPSPVLTRSVRLAIACQLRFGQASARVLFVGFTAKSFTKHCYSSRPKEPTGLFGLCEPLKGVEALVARSLLQRPPLPSEGEEG